MKGLGPGVDVALNHVWYCEKHPAMRLFIITAHPHVNMFRDVFEAFGHRQGYCEKTKTRQGIAAGGVLVVG